jgi:hypothetical protein
MAKVRKKVTVVTVDMIKKRGFYFVWEVSLSLTYRNLSDLIFVHLTDK